MHTDAGRPANGARVPRCLWLTLADPEPRYNGQFVYSGGLIDAVAQSGTEVEVLGLSRPDSPGPDGRDPRIIWRLVQHRPLSHWGSLTSPLPHIAYRCRTAEMRRLLDDLLAQDWDGIVFDGLSVGWALTPVQQHYARRRKRPRLIYVSHNHEESLRAQIAERQGWFLKRQAVRLDALKVSRLERGLVDAVDLVTAITPEDRRLYRVRQPSKPIEVLTPGYEGRRVTGRQITADLPRRAIIVGSYDWIAKRMNLEDFVSVADPLFAARGAELAVIGSAEESFLDRLRKSAVATTFTGTVPDVTGYMDQARIAIVPELSGGGFKLKVLEYVFNRLPIFGLNGSVAGVPLRPDDGIRLFDDHAALARGVLDAMDDIDQLNQIQQRAFVACGDKFDWASRGRQLRSALAGS
ncbi:glycosyltransferase [Reyranella sp. CPCC 100927]|uniref:glycosyltransferase n=1 Tax=Reyranella sp. CPCC 100927 TaxID=2599616 RepID=UPI0011B39B1A|nr:glycosyltransferase [Reyranella sp. CPCC 100927]TWT12963.1 glycosyltransferase family 4 protein [Reyranella sp. CPCC 100927]